MFSVKKIKFCQCQFETEGPQTHSTLFKNFNTEKYKQTNKNYVHPHTINKCRYFAKKEKREGGREGVVFLASWFTKMEFNLTFEG